MILISQALHFTLHKAADDFNRSFLVQGTDLNLYAVDDVSRVLPLRLSKESRIMIKRIWPLFVQAEGLRPAGALPSTPASMAVILKHSGTPILINDWENGIQNLGIMLEPPTTAAPFVEMQLQNFAFSYDGLNMQDIYNNTAAKAYICLEIDAVPYV